MMLGKHPRHLLLMSFCYKPAISQRMLPDTHHTAPVGQEVMQMAGEGTVRIEAWELNMIVR